MNKLGTLTFDDEALQKSIDIHGSRLKDVICMEEMAELTKELSKIIRNQGNIDAVIEETADVYICLEHIRLMHGINDSQLQNVIDHKINRQTKRDEKYMCNTDVFAPN